MRNEPMVRRLNKILCYHQIDTAILSDITGISHGVLYHILSGDRVLDIQSLHWICWGLSLDIGDLFPPLISRADWLKSRTRGWSRIEPDVRASGASNKENTFSLYTLQWRLRRFLKENPPLSRALKYHIDMSDYTRIFSGEELPPPMLYHLLGANTPRTIKEWIYGWLI